MGNNDMGHMDYLSAVSAADVSHLNEKEATYRGSWKRRGGCGAYLMACRKFDRLEGILDGPKYNWDIFAAIAADPSGADGTALAEIRDLRRYLLLIEAEMVSRVVVELARVTPPVMPAPSPAYQAPFKPVLPQKPPQRIMDGLQPIDYIEVGVHYLTTFDFGQPYYLVNRYSEPRSVWEHLPRLAVELNDKEREETPPEYRGLYTWSGEKWVMSLMHREGWGKEP